MTARDELDQIRQRAGRATDGPWFIDSIESGEHAVFVSEDSDELGWGGSRVAQGVTGTNAEFIAAARSDVPCLVAALTAALDLADECEEVASLAVCNPEWRDAHAMFATTLRAAITEHLTRKGKPHLAIAKLTSWRETATAIAAGLGTQPVEWLDEDDAVRDRHRHHRPPEERP